MNEFDGRETRRRSARFPISIAAEMVEVHAQTLRHYERIGLIAPKRSEGKIRYYTLAGDSLVIRTAQQPSGVFPGKQVVGTLTYERER